MSRLNLVEHDPIENLELSCDFVFLDAKKNNTLCCFDLVDDLPIDHLVVLN